MPLTTHFSFSRSWWPRSRGNERGALLFWVKHYSGTFVAAHFETWGPDIPVRRGRIATVALLLTAVHVQAQSTAQTASAEGPAPQTRAEEIEKLRQQKATALRPEASTGIEHALDV